LSESRLLHYLLAAGSSPRCSNMPPATLLPSSNEFRAAVALYGAKKNELTQHGENALCKCPNCDREDKPLYERTSYQPKRTARYHVNKSRSRKWKPGDPLSFWTRDEVLAELRRDLHLPNDADEYLPGASLACTQSASTHALHSQRPLVHHSQVVCAAHLCDLPQTTALLLFTMIIRLSAVLP